MEKFNEHAVSTSDVSAVATEKNDPVNEEPMPNDLRTLTQSLRAVFSTQNPSEEEVREVSSKLIEAHPDYAESIIALIQLPQFFAAQRDMKESQMLDKMGVLSMERRQAEREKRYKLVQELTQFQYLLTHFVVSHMDNEDLLKKFWPAGEQIAKDDHSSGEMSMLRDSILSQAAIYHLFKELGKNPRLSHPKEDAFYAVDLWTEDHQAIQVKGAPKYETFTVVSAADDTISFPGVALDDEGKVKHYNSYISHERQYMRAKLSQYRRMEGKDVEGFLVVIPRNKRNSVTARPDKEIVELARKSLGLAREASLQT